MEAIRTCNHKKISRESFYDRSRVKIVPSANVTIETDVYKNKNGKSELIIKLLHYNIQGLSNKSCQLEIFLKEGKYDIVSKRTLAI